MRTYSEFKLPLPSVKELVSADGEAPALEISGISFSDSEIKRGDLFVAVKGFKQHGASFAKSAIAKGAVAILTDHEGSHLVGNFPVLVTKDPRSAAGEIASVLYREPMRELTSIGITGTNGKTTVTTLLYQLFMGASQECGLIGTIENRIGKESYISSRTTPESSEIQSLAAVMRERHLKSLVMEVSSHAMSLKRLKGAHFNIVGFTNLTQDHLDFHNTMEGYFAAKSSLFTFEYADKAFINIDDEYGALLASQTELPVVSLSRHSHTSHWHYVEIESDRAGNRVSIRGTGGILIEGHTVLRGGYNLDNLLMAIAISHESGVDPLVIEQLIPSLKGATGRLEELSLGQNYSAFVDYAHSPDAVANVLHTAREFTSGKILAVLGCGGDRDATKRALMGKALVAGSDIAIFTSDNPRSEDPVKILNDMTSNLSFSPPSKVIVDREEAIRYAISLAGEGDCVLILGKGHETGQDIGGIIQDFDDRMVLARAIEERA